MPEPTTPAAAAILKVAAGLVPGAVGAAIALRFNTTDISPRQRWLSFAAGIALAHYGGGALAEQYNLTGMVADAARMAIGLFGLGLAAGLNAELPQIIAAARRKLMGETP
jgi:hypothetical protein